MATVLLHRQDWASVDGHALICRLRGLHGYHRWLPFAQGVLDGCGCRRVYVHLP